MTKISKLDNKIVIFRKKLDDLLDEKSMASGEVLELSKELDGLITEFYSENSGTNHKKYANI